MDAADSTNVCLKLVDVLVNVLDDGEIVMELTDPEEDVNAVKVGVTVKVDCGNDSN